MYKFIKIKPIAKELGLDDTHLVEKRIHPELKAQFDKLELTFKEAYEEWKKTFSYIKASYKRK